MSPYLHEDLDVGMAELFWLELTTICVRQSSALYRANPDAGLQYDTYKNGCVPIRFACINTHRVVMGLVGALLASTVIPG